MGASQADALGQLLLIELEDAAWSARLERWLRRLSPGGIVFSTARPPSGDDAAGLLALIAAALGYVPFLTLEEDGGKKSLLRHLLPPLPSPRAAARLGAPAAGRLGDLVGAGMKLLGFNTNLAPVLDLLTPFSEALLGRRSFGSEAQEVARCARAFVRGLSSHRVLACGKHFPGLGGAQRTAASAWPVVDKTMAELWREDLVPYRELIGDAYLLAGRRSALRAELPFVMLSPCAYKAYDFDVPRPAAVSPGVVEGLLRAKLGYNGLSIADLRQPGSAGVSPGRSLTLAAPIGWDDGAAQPLMAGCDMLVTSAEGAGKVLTGLRRALELGWLSTPRVDQSLERVRGAQKRLTRPSGRTSKAAVDQLARRFQRFSQEYQAALP
jgi:beta-N-acetylhexosaminidase